MMMKCAVCGYDDLGTGDSAHVCSTSVFMKYATPPSPSTAPIAEDELRAAATEVLKRWDTPLWRQEVGTAALMNRLRAALSSRPAGEVEELRALVEEWLCESCNTVYPGPPARGFACVICPKCGGSTGPRMLMENRKLRAALALRTAGEVELPPLPKPYAWSHTMDNTEGLKGNKPHRVLMFSKRSPFGRPGIDFSESYPVTAEALFTADQLRAYGQECARAALASKPAAQAAKEKGPTNG